MNWLVWIVLAVVATAAIIDIRTHRIPNLLTFPALIAGLVLQFVLNGPSGLVMGLLGAVVGLLLFLLPFSMGGMGAGDVKLMAVAGAFLGPAGALWAALFSGVAGGVLAIVWGILHKRLGRVFSRTTALMATAVDSQRREAEGLPTLEREKGWTIPYGVAIAFGVALSIWWRGI